MFTQRRTHLANILLSAGLLLLTTAGQSAMLANNLQTTATPAASNSTLTPQPGRSVETPLILRSHRSCLSKHANFCENGGQCMYPHDNDKPFCICTSSYSGPRCLFLTVTDEIRRPAEFEQVIAISFGVLMFLFVLAIIFYCIGYKRCIKSKPLIKSPLPVLNV